MSLIVATFYKFVPLSHLCERRQELLEFCTAHPVKGTILLASEGINGTIAGHRADIDAVLAKLKTDLNLADVDVKESQADTFPFGRMKVKIKPELISLGVPDIDPSQTVGTYVNPQEWNALISADDVILIDTRNDYEVAIGTFEGAQNPHLASFRQFPDYAQQHLDPDRHTKVAMFCTGGIRCEKVTAYLLKQGFEKVYHLKGGILKYLEEIPAEESLWDGECFVFDERVAVAHGLEPGSYDMCRACGHPISEADKASPAYEPGVSCPHCVNGGEPTQYTD